MLDVRWPGSGLDVRPRTSLVPGRSQMRLSVESQWSCFVFILWVEHTLEQVAVTLQEPHVGRSSASKEKRENVHMEGDGCFWEDATAWPRLLLFRARDLSVPKLLLINRQVPWPFHLINQSSCTTDQPTKSARSIIIIIIIIIHSSTYAARTICTQHH